MAEEKREVVVQAARQVFLRYGFKRVTMNDLAQAAGMSRPALYLVFPSKEDVFTAVMQGLLQQSLNEIRLELGALETPFQKLSFAFEVWCVRPFELIQTSPDAKDLLESGASCAFEVMTQATEEFTGLIAEVLEPLVGKQSAVPLSSIQIARVLSGAIPGFKTSSANAAQLRQSIADLLTLVLASLR